MGKKQNYVYAQYIIYIWFPKESTKKLVNKLIQQNIIYDKISIHKNLFYLNAGKEAQVI